MTPTTTLPWTQPGWLRDANGWIEQAVTGMGNRLLQPPEQFHVQVWSTVMRVYTDAGLLYFKASSNPKELRLTLLLRDLQPGNLPDLVAWDTDRSWFLMRNSGAMLRTYLKTPADLRMVEPALAQYAGLQMDAVTKREELIAVGVEERRVNRLAGMFAGLLAQPDALRIGYEDGLTEAQYARLIELLPVYEETCGRLQACRVPATLHHDDFHDGNIFVAEARGGRRFIFSDWEESFLTHPFFSIMLFLRSAGSRAGFPDEATEAPERMPPELNRLRDAYLEPWQVYEDARKLVETFNLAWRVGMVSRTLTWRAFVLSLDENQRGDYTYFVPAWLGEFLLAMAR